MHDVIIAGAGPAGLCLALELRLAGLAVLVLERADDPRSPLKHAPFGLRGLSVPTLEAFDRRGLLDDLRTGSQRATPPRGQAGHFAGIPLDPLAIDASRWTYRLPSPADSHAAADMASIETVLADRAVAMGVEIRRGLGVDGFEASDDGVIVRAGDRAFRAGWLVGCDGGRSTVRKAGGFEFVGTDPLFTGYSVKVDIADPETLRMGRTYTPAGFYFQSQPGVIAMADFDGGVFHRSAPLTLDHVQAVLRRVSGTEVTLTALHVATSWTDRAQQATTYRRGRVLLAGDAAHIHAPLGGQGLNLGLGDAMNLGWKLAATVRGEAPEGLLDSYGAERHPIGARVLDWSRAQVSILQPSPHARAMEAIVRDLVATRDGATYVAERLRGVSLRHDAGEDLGSGHPLTGRSAPDFTWRDGRRLAALLRDGKGRLLDFDGREPLGRLAKSRGGRLAYVAGAPEERLGLSAVLVRPDGIVAWACDGAPDLDEAAAAASRWFGRTG